MSGLLSWAPPVPQDPAVNWLTVDPDFGSLIRIGRTWVNLGVRIDNESLRSRIAQRLVNYYEDLYKKLIFEDGFGASELIDDLDYIKDTIAAWRLWGRGQDVYRRHSMLWAEENMKRYGKII